MISSKQSYQTHFIPVAPLAGHAGLRLIGATVKEALLSVRIQAEAILAYYEEFRPAVVFPLMDLTVECEAVGAEVRYEPDDAPSVDRPVVHEAADLARLRRPEVGLGNRLGVFVDALAWARRHLPRGATLAAYIIGPFTMAGRLMGLAELATTLVLEPELAHDLITFCTEVLSDYLRALLTSDPDMVWILDPSTSLISPAHAESFSLPYLRRLVDEVRAAGRRPVIHNCGRIEHLVPLLTGLDPDGLSVGSRIDMAALAKVVPEKVTLYGNLDLTAYFVTARPEETAAATTELLAAMAGRKNFVLATGCDLPPNLRLENLRAFFAAARVFPYRMVEARSA
ncbi:MAG: uroporphyrinogen decarboxylase family protein [Bacillota bacterium]